ncbi:uncharacterized protein KIAA0825 homolog isoform X2 [Esox lucius]|uniref:KIAA0825 n=2 Tax=Esox lucius TaxID=8010 RepID=A0A3P8YPC8_ESOLU|nr:uncharacterized protein KIAA0825 homolog isoform X2 [Esox lucius]XP_034152495.1 uncharacterized protein KIAA0825 homolog isoform X2 [Esox lucius]
MEWQGHLPQDHAFVELLVPGIPSELDVQQLLRDTEEKLKLNADSIEQSLKALQQKMGESWTEEPPLSPTECLQWFSPRNPSAVRAVATGHQELLDFLKAVLHYLKTDEEEREDLTLQLLVNISSQCGVSFPGGATSSTLMKPGPSVHAAREEGPLESLELWDEVRLLLRRRLLDRLALPLPVPRRIHCLQQLLFLYPAWEVLTLYQGLRSRAALSLLHSALGSGPGATGFDRLALGVGAAAPALCSAIREELHVLNGVADPHTILGFLNAAYLDTVSRELAAMMGRECESALKDNTMLSSSKGRRISARPKTAVAPLEVAPETGRNFSLTAHQLRALTQLACTLLGLERQVEELATQLAFINCAGETPCSVRGILKKTKDNLEMTAVDYTKTTGEMLFQSPEPLVLEFEWRTAFRELVPQIAHCVKVVLEDVCSKALRQEEELSLLSGSAHIALTNTPDTDDSALTCPGRDIPKMVAKFCGDIIRECNALLPLAEACGDGVLLEVRCSFVEACARVASAMLGRVEERAGQVPSGAPLKNLATLLGTSVYVHQWLCHYHDRLKETSASLARVPLTLLPIQRYLDVTEGLREQLTSYCGQVCSSTILQDAESHDWAHTKTFYEGERCSFSVQMWHYFLSGLRADLWLAVPGCVGRDVLAQVVSESLQVLVQRYSRARPSYRRHLQIRFDITAVLLCVEQLMWSLCERTESLLGLEPSAGRHAWVATIHSLCDQLLTTLVIVTAPLAHLYRTFQDRLGEDSTPAPVQPPGVHWLSAIHPGLFSTRAVRDGLVGDAASECQLRLLTSDPGYSPRLLLTSILHRDCHLLRVLLESSYFCRVTDVGAVSPVRSGKGDSFMEAVFGVLSSLNNVPKALTLALETYLHKGRVWGHLYSLPDSTRSVPVVVSCVRAVVIQPVHGLLGPLVNMVLTWQASEEPCSSLPRRDVPDSVLSKVPKEWSYAPATPGRREPIDSVVNLAVQALSFIYTNLPLAVASIPLPVRFLFHTAEKHLSQHARQLRSTGLLIWSLLSCLCQLLEEPNSLELLWSLPLDQGAKENLSLLSECLQGSMGQGQQKGVPKPTVHKVLQVLEENRPKWSSMQLLKARKLCSESAFEQGESGVAQERDGSVDEATERKKALALLEICHKPGGAEYLRQIYHIIRVNEALLRSKLCVSSDATDDSQVVTFNLEPDSPVHASPRFNPLHQFKHIGSNGFDQSAVGGWTWDWATLLPAYQRMSRLTVTTLLANRWEMQDGADLEDEETTLVEELQKAYFNQSPGSRAPPGVSQAAPEEQHAVANIIN